MNELPSKLEDLNYNSVSIERAEMRNGKIIVVIKPKILSNQVFAVNPYYDEGDAKNQLQEASFNISVSEKGGSVKCNASFGNGLGHFTKGCAQIHTSMSKLLTSKIELAVHEVLTCDTKYLLDGERMAKLVKNLKSEKERRHAESLIIKRKMKIEYSHVEKKKAELIYAMKEYEDALTGKVDTFEDDY